MKSPLVHQMTEFVGDLNLNIKYEMINTTATATPDKTIAQNVVLSVGEKTIRIFKQMNKSTDSATEALVVQHKHHQQQSRSGLTGTQHQCTGDYKRLVWHYSSFHTKVPDESSNTNAKLIQDQKNTL